jgi:heme/copper-type cytochrome/quinol oxidase subunit 2
MAKKFLIALFFLLLPLAACNHKAPQPIRVAVEMKKYAITPAELHLKLGQPVQFEITAKDVQHGFDVPDLGIKEPAQPGRPASFIYTPNKKGVFTIECGVICGPMHDDMRGKIVVE